MCTVEYMYITYIYYKEYFNLWSKAGTAVCCIPITHDQRKACTVDSSSERMNFTWLTAASLTFPFHPEYPSQDL